MRTDAGLSTVVSVPEIITSLVLFGFVYVLLFVLFVFMLNHKIHDGPENVRSEEYEGVRRSMDAMEHKHVKA
jgi:cytochrome d ubiquinol oxidase subunit I